MTGFYIGLFAVGIFALLAFIFGRTGRYGICVVMCLASCISFSVSCFVVQVQYLPFTALGLLLSVVPFFKGVVNVIAAIKERRVATARAFTGGMYIVCAMAWSFMCYSFSDNIINDCQTTLSNCSQRHKKVEDGTNIYYLDEIYCSELYDNPDVFLHKDTPIKWNTKCSICKKPISHHYTKKLTKKEYDQQKKRFKHWGGLDTPIF